MFIEITYFLYFYNKNTTYETENQEEFWNIMNYWLCKPFFFQCFLSILREIVRKCQRLPIISGAIEREHWKEMG